MRGIWQSNKIKIMTIAVVLFIELILLLHNYASYPQRGATSDEYTYAFLGQSLITKHMPVSWSFFGDYTNKFNLTIRGIFFPMVYPYFDHPPLFGLLVGGWALLNGQSAYQEVQLSTIRVIPIVLYMISSLLLFFIAKKLYGYKTALFSLLIYGTTTTFIVQGRVVLAENLLTPLILLGIFLYLAYRKTMRVYQVVLLGLVAGLAYWAKETGIIVVLTLLLIFVFDKIKRKNIFIFSAVSLIFILLYVLYGLYYNGALFFAIQTIQSSRPIGPETFPFIISTPIIINKIYQDGWYLFGFFALFNMLINYKKNIFVAVPTLVYLLIMVTSLTKEGMSGWYMIPLFPFMALSISHLLVSGIKEKNWVVFLLFFFVGLSEIKYLVAENFGLVNSEFRVMIAVLFIPLLAFSFFKKEHIFNFVSEFWFYFLILGNIIITYTYIHPS